MAKDEGRDAECYEKESKPPEWLVMIYLAGDNNLSANTIAIMQELEAAAPPSKNVRVVACFDPNTPRPRGARYVEVNHRRHNQNTGIPYWDLHNDLVPFEELPGHPVTTPDFCGNPIPGHSTTEPLAKVGLSRFLDFALSKHKADRYMLILFGHGSAVAGNTFLIDDNPPSFLRLKDFADVLSDHFDTDPRTKKPALDILACDNCMMNGIESAYQIKNQVRYVIGSQGLVLALGWPFRRIIREVVAHKSKSTERVARRVLRACARNLIDFSLMDRSSEQSLCDLTKLDKRNKLIAAVRGLACIMQEALASEIGKTITPASDAIRLARLEAQSYWSETFVDLYDFCALLLERCNHLLAMVNRIAIQLQKLSKAQPAGDSSAEAIAQFDTSTLPFVLPFGSTAAACKEVLSQIRPHFVLASYYVGPQLQYSNGVSIYFPWTLPEDPIIFDPEPGSGGGGSYTVSWATMARIQRFAAMREASASASPPGDIKLITAFEEYETYDFAKCDAGDWSSFLKVFFRATLRNVRRFEVEYIDPKTDDEFFHTKELPEERHFDLADVDLQKSSSDADNESDCKCPTIKNYPRRFYLSPADCKIMCPPPRKDRQTTDDREHLTNCPSYLGWNIRGIVAEEIGLPPGGPRGRKAKSKGESAADAADTSSGDES
jgi:hypothetical protein